MQYIRQIAASIELEADAADAFIKIGRPDLSEQCLSRVKVLVWEVAA